LIEAKVRQRLARFQLDVEFMGEGVTCIAGRNGAGKTSLLKAIAGLIRIDEGYVRIGSVDVTNLPVEKRGAVMVTQGSSLPHLDVDSHLTWGARLRGRGVRTDEVSKVRSALGIDFGGPVRSLSMGMRQRVALATALLASPKVILVDEAFSSLHARGDFIASYSALTKEAGIDLVFASQDEADGKLAEHLFVLADGSLVR
jgi:molybdate/tungstate transport system ATP-binding protein